MCYEGLKVRPRQGDSKFLGSEASITSHTFRHSFATHLSTAGSGIRTVQELLGHSDVRTMTIYTRVLNQGGRVVRSPAHQLARLPDER